jgi:hypothetical protein
MAGMGLFPDDLYQDPLFTPAIELPMARQERARER